MDVGLWEWVWRRTMKMLRGLEHLCYENKLRVRVVQSGGKKAPRRPRCGATDGSLCEDTAAALQ